MRHLMIPVMAPDMRRPSRLKGLPLLVEMIAPEVLDIRSVMGVGYLLAWLACSFWANRRFDGHRVS